MARAAGRGATTDGNAATAVDFGALGDLSKRHNNNNNNNNDDDDEADDKRSDGENDEAREEEGVRRLDGERKANDDDDGDDHNDDDDNDDGRDGEADVGEASPDVEGLDRDEDQVGGDEGECGVSGVDWVYGERSRNHTVASVEKVTRWRAVF